VLPNLKAEVSMGTTNLRLLLRKKSAHDYIHIVPRYISHYSRDSKPNNIYCDCHLSLYRPCSVKYVLACNNKKIKPVSEDKHHRIFFTEFNTSFKLPKSDTCRNSVNLII
jgi:hypothetical protein